MTTSVNSTSPSGSKHPSTKRTYQSVKDCGYTALADILRDATSLPNAVAGLPVLTRASRQSNPTSLSTSSQTTMSKYETNENGKVFKEIQIRFEFPVDTCQQTQSTQDLHLQLLELLEQSFSGNIQIITNRNNKIKEKRKISKDRHSTEFDIHIKKNKTTTKHILIHRIRTTVSLRDIKTNTTICPFLEKHGIFIKPHAWSAEDWDTVHLGWKLFTHPSRDFVQELHHHLNQFVSKKMPDTSLSDLPQIRLIPSNPSIKFKDTVYNTRALDLQTLQKHASKMDSLLLEFFNDSSQYVKYSLKHQDPSAFSQSIQLQNKYLSEFRTITVSGVTDEAMFYLQGMLKSIQGIHNIRPANLYTNNGKWHLITNRENFFNTHELLRKDHGNWDNHLPSITKKQLYQKYPDGITLQQVTTKTKPTTDDPSVQGSVNTLQDSYVSQHSRSIKSMASVFSSASTSPQFTTTPREIQFSRRNDPTWSEVASITYKNSSQHNDSHNTPSTIHPSTSTFQTLQEENARLKQKIAALEEAQHSVETLQQQVADLTNKLSQLQHNYQNSSTDATLQYLTMTQATNLFQNLLQRHNESQFSPSHPTPERPLTQEQNSPMSLSKNSSLSQSPDSTSQQHPPPKTLPPKKHTRPPSKQSVVQSPSSTGGDSKRRNTSSTPESFSSKSSRSQDTPKINPHYDPSKHIIDSAERDGRAGLRPESPLIPPAYMSPLVPPTKMTDAEVEKELISWLPPTPPSKATPTPPTTKPPSSTDTTNHGIAKRLFLGEAQNES